MFVRTFGIVNVTRDSFSDGGRWLEPAAAIGRAERLWREGADVIDVGAESTHPDAEDVTAGEEIARLTPVVTALIAAGMQVSVDTVKPVVMRAMAGLGVPWINDVGGLRDPDAVAAVAASPSTRVVVMFSRASGTRAERTAVGVAGLVDAIERFFAERLATLTAAGIHRDRIVFDPGMGFFLGTDATASLSVLRALPRLRRVGQPLLLSVSRKSFLGAITGRAVGERGAATLAAELWAYEHGVDFIRTHDVAALRDAIAVRAALVGATGELPTG
ncbi:MAG: dihydropteroate synthase [Planctomycetes bacterium]|nr:dihydropteroate synthase [Planctomycetota bacterium]